ncbi:MAG TPA: YoaK family protein [Magnetospirillaceae bacterium]|nr:YoaK family protein [Magnetospirillaceae bacterium]
MKIPLSPVLSFNAGYIDTAGFLALSGLFTAHVTGNFVTFGAAMAQGSSGVLAKLLVLPVFCAVIIVTRIIAQPLQRDGRPVMRIMMGVKFLLLAIAAFLAIGAGPITDSDAWPGLAVGLTLAAAMAIQNAIHRVHMSTEPPTTLMTGSTTQIMIDVADLISGVAGDNKPVLQARLKRLSANVISFAVGCGLAAAAWKENGNWCFVLPPILALITPFLPPAEVPRKA